MDKLWGTSTTAKERNRTTPDPQINNQARAYSPQKERKKEKEKNMKNERVFDFVG
jgi:hypothetical protein